MATLFQIKENIAPQLMDISGVVGVGISVIKNTINVYVEKITDELISVIPKEIEGYKTEIIETGRFEALQTRREKWRPAPGGVSIGHPLITAGTFGTACIDNVSKKRAILSNNHVLANADSIQNSRANKGDATYQPGSYDGGTSADTIANLERWVKMDEAGTNTVDCAIAKPINDADLSDDVLEMGPITGMMNATEDLAVQKSGRTTELNTGTVSDVNATIDVNYGGKFVARFTDQIVTGNMASGGDSGSALCTMDNKIVGLLFAGSATRTIHCKIGNVADLLDIDFGPTAPTPPVPILPLLLGAGALLALPMIIKPAKKPKKKPMIPEKKVPTKGLIIGGVLIAGAIGLYFLLKKKPEPEPPPEEVSAEIREFTIAAS